MKNEDGEGLGEDRSNSVEKRNGRKLIEENKVCEMRKRRSHGTE